MERKHVRKLLTCQVSSNTQLFDTIAYFTTFLNMFSMHGLYVINILCSSLMFNEQLNASIGISFCIFEWFLKLCEITNIKIERYSSHKLTV